MGQLFLVRHGQASFLEDNYDRLSTLGWTQSRMLGEYLGRHGLSFDRICSGPMTRQIDTAQAFIDAYKTAGKSLPSLDIFPEFAEYSGDSLLAHGLERLLPVDETLAQLHASFKAAHGAQERRATFQRVFERILARWVDGSIDAPGFESWIDFRGRVDAGLDRLMASGPRSQRVLLFTSGGPIAVVAGRALQLSPQATIQVSFMCHNASWSHFLYSGSERFSLSSFNNTPHFGFDPTLITYR